MDGLGDEQGAAHRWCNSPEREYCCSDQACSGDWTMILEGGGGSKRHHRRHSDRLPWTWMYTCCFSCLKGVRRVIKTIVEHKYFQQGILLAILINTLSMGIEYHNQVVEFLSFFLSFFLSLFLSLFIYLFILLRRCSPVWNFCFKFHLSPFSTVSEHCLTCLFPSHKFFSKSSFHLSRGLLLFLVRSVLSVAVCFGIGQLYVPST